MGAAGVGGGMTAFFGALGFGIGTFASIGTARQMELLKVLKKSPETIHIYPDKLYIKTNSPIHKTVPTQILREATLLDSDQSHYEFDIIYQNRQFSYK